MAKALLALLLAVTLHAQIDQLATSADGSVLLFRSGFRLQTETDLGAQGKIYRYQNGQFTRLAEALVGTNFYTSQPDVFSPFLSSDAQIYGWQIAFGCLHCTFNFSPLYGSAVTGAMLPTGFPTGTLKMSANGRYFTGDEFQHVSTSPFPAAPKYFDSATGQVSALPVQSDARPAIRDPVNDGTVLLLTTAPDNPMPQTAVVTLALWKPGSDPQVLLSSVRIPAATISSNGNAVAAELIAPDGSHSLNVSGNSIPLTFREANLQINSSIAQPNWDLNGTNLLYRDIDSPTGTEAIYKWNAATAVTTQILLDPSGFKNAVLSGDGNTIWAVTKLNRLIRYNVQTAETEQILALLSTFKTNSYGGVPGSALFIAASDLNDSYTATEAGAPIPILSITPRGITVQIPWEDAAQIGTHRILLRAPGTPFEIVANVGVGMFPAPVLLFADDSLDTYYAKALHEDFQSLITPDKPAHSGETVHFYLTGLGPLDQPLATGAPGPSSPPLHPLAQIRCALNSYSPNMVPVLTYAPGMIGIYQADIPIPADVNPGIARLFCSWSNSTSLFSTSADFTIAK